MKRPTLKRYSDKDGVYKWLVWHNSPNGTRIKRKFRTKKDATNFLNDKETEFESLGNKKAAVLTDTLKSEAADAIEKLSEVNATLSEAVEYFLKHQSARKRSKDVAEAVEEWLSLRRKDGSRHRTLLNLQSRARRLKDPMEGRLVAEIGTPEILSYLEGIEGTQQTRKNHRAVLSAFFGWAKLRGLTDRNPVQDIPTPKVEGKDPEIFTPKQMKDMLEATAGDTQLTAWLVLCGFAGIRTEESERLNWEDIDFTQNTIDVPPDSSKVRRYGRAVDLEANAKQWLRPIAKDSGKILPDWFHMSEKVREFKENLEFDWSFNGLRHSYASYHLYRGNDAGKTAMMLGYNGNPQTLFQHYRRRVKPADAKAWFQIKPKASKGRIVELNQGAA